MSDASDDDAREIAAVQQAIGATAPRLHGIASRSQGDKIAVEVLRLNDTVRAGAAGRIDFSAQPTDFPALLLARADIFDEEAE